jgi:spore maturation protein CgeB
MLGKIAKKINSTFFAGTNWPEGINASKEKIYNPSDLSALFQSSLFNLDLGNGQSFSGLNMRSYEIMACGGILVKNQLPDFDPCGELQGKIYLKFSSSEEVQEILKSYRSKPEKLDEIRNNARQFILEKHTWLNRFSELISGLS